MISTQVLTPPQYSRDWQSLLSHTHADRQTTIAAQSASRGTQAQKLFSTPQCQMEIMPPINEEPGKEDCGIHCTRYCSQCSNSAQSQHMGQCCHTRSDCDHVCCCICDMCCMSLECQCTLPVLMGSQWFSQQKLPLKVVQSRDNSVQLRAHTPTSNAAPQGEMLLQNTQKMNKNGLSGPFRAAMGPNTCSVG